MGSYIDPNILWALCGGAHYFCPKLHKFSCTFPPKQMNLNQTFLPSSYPKFKK